MDMAARYSGDVFAVTLSNAPAETAQILQHYMDSTIFGGGRQICTDLSFHSGQTKGLTQNRSLSQRIVRLFEYHLVDYDISIASVVFGDPGC